MSQGTLTLTNNSTTVTGSGTIFTTDLKPNDFLVAVVGGVTYTLGVQSISNNTSLVLTTVYNGPTGSGNAWTALPNAALVGITAQVAADVARAIRGLNLDKSNWQQVFSGAGNITVTLPDGSTYSGPSWSYLANTAATKVSGAVPINQGGTGATTASDGLANLRGLPISGGTSTGVLKSTGASYVVSQLSGYGEFGFQFPTSLAKLAYMFTENLGDLVFVTTERTISGTEKYFAMRQSGQLTTQGNITCVSLTQTSSRDQKDRIEKINPVAAIENIDSVDGYTFSFKEGDIPSSGVMADEWLDILPECISTAYCSKEAEESQDLKDRKYGFEYSGAIAFLIAALKGEKAERKALEERLSKLEK